MCKTKETKILICAFLILRSALLQASNIQQASTPTGPAGGALTGTYPNPTLTGVTSLGAIAVGSSTTGVLSQVALGSAGALLYAGASGPVWSSTSALVWDAANGRLGIGTASPSNLLDLSYSDNAFGRGMKIRNTSTGTQAITGVGLFNSSNSNVANFEYYPSNYANAAVANFAAFSTLGGVTGLMFQTDISSGSGSSDIRFGSASSTYMAIRGTTGSVGIGPSNTSPTGTLSCYDATPTTGNTNCSFRAGAGQSGNVLRVLNTGGTEVAGVNSTGNIFATGGIFLDGGGTWSMAGLVMRMRSDVYLAFASGTNATGTLDTGLGRNAAGIVEVNNGTPGTFRGLRASYVQSSGTTFTASGCSVSALTGGATAGRYTSGTTGACTVTVTMGNSATATNGWSCYASNRTTANLMRQTATTTTTATFDGTTVSGDVISFGCIGN